MPLARGRASGLIMSPAPLPPDLGGRLVPPMRDPVIGIDLGTTNSAVATVEEGQPRIIPSRAGGRLTPSVVGLTPKAGERVVGAKAQSARRGAPGLRGVGHQALHRAALHPGAAGGGARRGALRARGGHHRGRAREDGRARAAHHPGVGDDPGRAEARRRGVLRPPGAASASSPSPPTSTTASARPRARRRASPAWRCCASSTSPPRRRSPTGSRAASRATRWCSIWAAAPSTCRSSRSPTASSR